MLYSLEVSDIVYCDAFYGDIAVAFIFFAFFWGIYFMKLSELAVASALMLAFTCANAADFEGSFHDNTHYSIEIVKNADNTYKMEFGGDMIGDNIVECSATAKINGDRLVVTERDCSEIEVDDSDNRKVVKTFKNNDRLEYVISTEGLDEYYNGDPDDVKVFERLK